MEANSLTNFTSIILLHKRLQQLRAHCYDSVTNLAISIPLLFLFLHSILHPCILLQALHKGLQFYATIRRHWVTLCKLVPNKEEKGELIIGSLSFNNYSWDSSSSIKPIKPSNEALKHVLDILADGTWLSNTTITYLASSTYCISDLPRHLGILKPSGIEF